MFCQNNCETIKSHGGKEIHFVSISDHLLNIDVKQLSTILQKDDIKNRTIVVVSIVGAEEGGKSFLMNLFLRYLDAQYIKHNATQWLDVNKTGESNYISGFEWGSVRSHGISMWPHIFTHDFNNENKVAIILLDTKGIDSIKGTTNEDARIYAFGAMASSVNCYNILRRIGSSSLEFLDLFNGYSFLSYTNDAKNKTKFQNRWRFQKLSIIVRDKPVEIWPFQYGQQTEDEKNKYFAKNYDQAFEKNEELRRINRYYENIDLFYMPSPGDYVTQSIYFDGNLRFVNGTFLKYVEKLAESILAPINLVVKKDVDGKPILAKHFSSYLEAYGDMVNANKLPDLKTYFQIILDTKYNVLQQESLDYYTNSMTYKLKMCKSYFNESEFQRIHNQFQNEALNMFLEERKLNTNEYLMKFEIDLKCKIEERKRDYIEENKAKEKLFQSSLENYYTKFVDKLEKEFKTKVEYKINRANPHHFYEVFDEISAILNSILKKFDDEDEFKNCNKYLRLIADCYRNKLRNKLDTILDQLRQIVDLKKNDGVDMRSNSASTFVFLIVGVLELIRSYF
ncbi:atlastin-like [Contarinia nasturtii]|uniref:atlastin-like n=1 Tax=Contarinia nasturtii TaxID=265458 RepID=UPI0012D3C272|nr:atlastin-like [Contarinia nasturtii]